MHEQGAGSPKEDPGPCQEACRGAVRAEEGLGVDAARRNEETDAPRG